jgi:hypothetical protein
MAQCLTSADSEQFKAEQQRKRDEREHERLVVKNGVAYLTSSHRRVAHAVHRTPRRRGAGRPRAAASRSSARSGDSGDDGPSSESDPAGRPARARIAAEAAWDGRAGNTADLARLLVSWGWSWVDARVAIGDCIVYGLLHPDSRGRLRRVER